MAESKSRRIVLTGVSRGLGRAMAAGLIERGHTVFGCSRSPHAVMALRETFGTGHRWDVVDVSDDAAVAAWAADILALGPPDLLINNAAIVNQPAALWNVPAEEFSRLIDVNVKAVANTVRHFAASMVARGSGVIVNFSSGWGRSTSPDFAPYCASKWAIEGLTRALAQELPAPMAAVPLNPGVINTEMLQSCFGPAAASYKSADEWAVRAVPLILGLGREHNGEPLSVPD